MSQFHNLVAILLTNTAASLPINPSTDGHKGVKSAHMPDGTLSFSLSAVDKCQLVHDSCMTGHQCSPLLYQTVPQLVESTHHEPTNQPLKL